MYFYGLIPHIITENDIIGLPAALLYFVGILLCAALPYLLGSLNFAIILSKTFFHEDIRSQGSHNAGTTNMLRIYGAKAAILTLLGDILKTVIAVFFGTITLGYLMGGGSIAGFFCILGHVFPIFSQFRGGKGFASAMAVMVLTNLGSWDGFFLILILIACFLIIALGTKYVSLASVMTMLLYPLLQSEMNFDYGVKPLLAICIATLVVVRHFGNIKRLREGTESKLSLPFGKNKKQ